jgi:ferrous iron transport protein A
MFNQQFKVTGSSLSMMRPGERGVVTSCNKTNEALQEKLMGLGLIPGTLITLERRFPRFIVKTGPHRIALDDRIVQSIYVRLAE